MKITKKRSSHIKPQFKSSLTPRNHEIKQTSNLNQLYNDLSRLIPKDPSLNSSTRITFIEAQPTPQINNQPTTYNLFGDSEVLEDQTYIALTYQALREDSNLYNQLVSLDWRDKIINPQKVNFLQELGGRVNSILKYKVDYINHYTKTLKEYLQGFNDIKDPNLPFNVNLAMFIELLAQGWIVLKETDSSYLNGQAILIQTYKGDDESFSKVCQNTQDNHSSCVVQYLKDLANTTQNGLTKNGNIIIIPTKENLEKVSTEFYHSKGYKSIFAYIVSIL